MILHVCAVSSEVLVFFFFPLIRFGFSLILSWLVEVDLCCYLTVKERIFLVHCLCLVLVFIPALNSLMAFLLLELGLFYSYDAGLGCLLAVFLF